MLLNFTTAWGLLTYHHRMLRDRARVRAFRDAIQASVRPGDLVLDIGTGTGILRSNRLHARTLHGDRAVGASRRGCYRDAWCFGIGEGLVSWVADARRRFLREGGQIVPEWVEPMVVPVGSRETRVQTEIDTKLLGGLDLAPFETVLGQTQCIKLSCGKTCSSETRSRSAHRARDGDGARLTRSSRSSRHERSPTVRASPGHGDRKRRQLAYMERKGRGIRRSPGRLDVPRRTACFICA